jgi:hypothetical protein
MPTRDQHRTVQRRRWISLGSGRFAIPHPGRTQPHLDSTRSGARTHRTPSGGRWTRPPTRRHPPPGRQTHRQIQRPTSSPARNRVAITQPPHRPRPTATPAQRQHPRNRPRPMAGRDPRHSMDPVSTGPRHRRESRATRRSPPFPTRTGRRGVPSSLLEPWARAGRMGPGRALELSGQAGRMWVRARALQSSARAGRRGTLAGTLEPWARAGRGWVPARLLEPWTRVSRGWIRACTLALRTRTRH